MIKAFLFDLDGTLIDSTGPIIKGFCDASQALGLPCPSRELILELIGYPLDFMFARLGVSDDQIPAIIKAYKESYAKSYLAGTTLKAGCDKALLLAKNTGAKIAAVTTKTSKYSRILLEHLGVGYYFDTIIGRDDVERPKPDKEPVQKALLTLGEEPKTALMIGDTIMDALSAKAAGAMAFGVLCGYGKEKDLKEHCDYVFADTLAAVEFALKNH